MNSQNNLKVFKNAAELTEACAAFIIETGNKAISARGKFVISLSGGHTPEQLYILLTKLPFRNQLNWNKTFIFWGDERCVPSDDAQNNAYMARTLLLDHIEMPAANIFPVPVDLPPCHAAVTYENTIRTFFGNELPEFDLVLLGLGENGHTASLFPGKIVRFESYLVRTVYVEEQKMFRVTMTPKLINQAHNIVFLVEGDNKAEILNTVLNGAFEPDKYPAQLIKPEDGKLYWFVDSKAAGGVIGLQQIKAEK